MSRAGSASSAPAATGARGGVALGQPLRPRHENAEEERHGVEDQGRRPAQREPALAIGEPLEPGGHREKRGEDREEVARGDEQGHRGRQGQARGEPGAEGEALAPRHAQAEREEADEDRAGGPRSEEAEARGGFPDEGEGDQAARDRVKDRALAPCPRASRSALSCQKTA